MKPFEYYNTIAVEYPNRFAYREKLKAEIANTPMTEAERVAAMKGVDVRVRQWFDEQVRPYNQEQTRLDNEFWRDCREDIGYDNFLDAAGCAALEGYAWQQGHSGGYSDVYCILADLAVLAEKLVMSQKTST